MGMKSLEANEKERTPISRDFDSGFDTPGLKFSQDSMACLAHKKEWTYQNGEATVSSHSDRLVQDNINSNDETVENSTSLGNNSMYSLKNLGQLHFAFKSNNACTASPRDETDAMRKWKEIKQNGFLSHPHGGVPMPEPQPGKKSKKRKQKGINYHRETQTIKVEMGSQKMETTKRKQENRKMEEVKGEQEKMKIETAKKMEQDNLLKSAPCSGLLSRISTGIIRRVKNYEEVHAILEAMLVDKHTCQMQS